MTTGSRGGRLPPGFLVTVVAAGTRIYASGMSSKARGVADDDLAGKPVELAMPARLVQLSLEADRVLAC